MRPGGTHGNDLRTEFPGVETPRRRVSGSRAAPSVTPITDYRADNRIFSLDYCTMREVNTAYIPQNDRSGDKAFVEDLMDSRLKEAAKEFAASKRRFHGAIRQVEDLNLLFDLSEQYYSDDPEIAMALLYRISELDPSSIRAAVELGDLAYLTGDNVEAYACYRRAADIDPDDRRVLLLKARLAQSPRELVEAYRRLAELHPDDESARKNLAMLRDRSEEELKSLVSAWPPGQHQPE